MKKMLVVLIIMSFGFGQSFDLSKLSIGVNTGFTADMFGLSSDFYDQNKGYLTDEIASDSMATTVFSPNSATLGFDFSLNATYDFGWFFVRADYRTETLISGGENTVTNTGLDYGGLELIKEQTTEGSITSMPIYLGVNIPVTEKGKVYAGLGYGYYVADAKLTLDLSGSYIDYNSDLFDTYYGATFDRQGVLEFSTTGTGVEYILGFESKINDNLSFNFNYSSGGGVEYGECEFDTYVIGGDGVTPVTTTTDYQLAEGFEELSSQFVYSEYGDGSKTKVMFPLKTAGSKLMFGISYHF